MKNDQLIDRELKIEKRNLGFYKYKNTIRGLFVLVVLITLLFVFFGIKKKDGSSDLKKKKIISSAQFKSEGGGMEYSGFNKKNEKTVKITCARSEEKKNDMIVMEKIIATFVPKSRVKNEIVISGANGVVENNLYNFLISGNATIRSKDFSIDSSVFTLKDRDVLTTDKPLKYKTKNLTGNAKGMKIHIDTNLLDFFDTTGFYKIKDQSYRYISTGLHLDDSKQTISFRKLKKKNIIRGDDFFLKGERIITKFSEDYKMQLYTHVIHDCHFNMRKKILSDFESIEFRDIKAKYINLDYSESGDISFISSRDHTKVELRNKSYQINISTNVFNMDFYEEKQSIKSIDLRSTNNDFFYRDLKGDNKEDFQLKGTEIKLFYNESGEISEWEVKDRRRAQFLSQKYSSEGGMLKYTLIDNTVLIQGKARVEVDQKNIFRSEEFTINTKKEILSSKEPVSANIQLENKSVLLSTNPIYVNSNSMEMDEANSLMKFKGKVFLIQDEVSIKTDKLIISDKKGIKCKSPSGEKSIIVFLNNKKEVVLKGENIELVKEEGVIKLFGNAVLKDEDNKIKGNNLIIHFNDNKIEKITGEGDIFFKKDKLIIESESVKWLYDSEMVFFEKLKKVEKKETGSIKGKKIKLDLKTNIMTVFSETDERTETVLD